MKRLIRMREKGARWEIMPSSVRVKLSEIAKTIRKLVVIKVSTTEFEVIDHVIDRERHYVVDLHLL